MHATGDEMNFQMKTPVYIEYFIPIPPPKENWFLHFENHLFTCYISVAANVLFYYVFSVYFLCLLNTSKALASVNVNILQMSQMGPVAFQGTACSKQKSCCSSAF